MGGGWKIETQHDAASERFRTEGAAIARAWEITEPGGDRPSVFFDDTPEPVAPRRLIKVSPEYMGEVAHVGLLPRPDFDQVGKIYRVEREPTKGYICVAKDDARFCTWAKILMSDTTNGTLKKIVPFLVRPIDDDN